MTTFTEQAVQNSWHAVGSPIDIRRSQTAGVTLLGQQLKLEIHDTWIYVKDGDRKLPVVERVGHIWTTFGDPPEPPPQLMEFYEVDRLAFPVAAIPCNCPAEQAIEGVLSSLLPAEHNDGAITTDGQAGLSAGPYRCLVPEFGAEVQCTIRVPHPHAVFQCCEIEASPDRIDVIGYFAQPVSPETSVLHKFVVMLQDDWRDPNIVRKDQIALVESQSLNPIIADETRPVPSVQAYRTWCAEKGFARTKNLS